MTSFSDDIRKRRSRVSAMPVEITDDNDQMVVPGEGCDAAERHSVDRATLDVGICAERIVLDRNRFGRNG